MRLDWYRFVTPAGDLYVLVTHVAPELKIGFRLWDADEGLAANSARIAGTGRQRPRPSRSRSP